MTLNVDFTQADGSFVRKAIPEEWRKEGEDDLALAQRVGGFFGFPDGWEADLNLRDVPADPVPVARKSVEDRLATIESALGIKG